MKRSKPLRRATPRRAKELRQYNALRREHLLAHQICEVCQEQFSNQIHHVAGRNGARLLDVHDWLAICSKCHAKIHSEGKWARTMGYRK